jgi:cytochrome c556
MNRFAKGLIGGVAVLFVCSVVVFAEPPRTDQQYEDVMKQVRDSFGALRKSLEGQIGADAGNQAQKVTMLFKDVEAFWTERKVEEAAGFAHAAVTHAQAIEKAVAGKDMTGANEHAKELQGVCQSCHGKYRDKAPDGSYQIKMP